jgi:SAM-dependent methyltransferase
MGASESRSLAHLETVLDRTAATLQAHGAAVETMEVLFLELFTIRGQVAADFWKEVVVDACRRHPLVHLLHQDSFTFRAFSKPRGYAGDAVLLDFMYAAEDSSTPPEWETGSLLGKQICHYTSTCSQGARAARSRRRVIIDTLNRCAAGDSAPSVLSLACGHLREARYCPALRQGSLGRFLAVDQDKESLAVVSRELAPWGVVPLAASVREILRGDVVLTGFDLVYATGLYDYLAEPVAQRLCERLLRMLGPGGRFLIANVMPTCTSAAYMEAYMDWWLLYRTETQMLKLAETLPDKDVEKIRVFTDNLGQIVFLEVEKTAYG